MLVYTGFLRDPVNGYVYYTELEKRIIDTRIFQRLRWIRQNDVAFLVYPSLNTTRFEHSLGVMHLAGRIAKAAFGARFKNDHQLTLLSKLRDRFATYGSGESVDPIDTIIKIVRVAGLLHDIGHLPLSHLTEHALSSSLKLIYPNAANSNFHQSTHEIKLHEFALFTLLMNKNSELCTAFKSKSDRVILQAVRSMFAKKKINASSDWDLAALKEIVDGEVDADRMDSCARDGRALGDEFGHFDVERLVSNFVVGEIPQVGIRLRPREQATSAVEALLIERLKVHQWIHYHHEVCAYKALTSHVIQALLENRLDPELRPEKFNVNGYCDFRNGTTIDDAWLFGRFEAALSSLKARSKPERLLRRMLQAVLFRERCFRELWEHQSQYRTFDKLTDSWLPFLQSNEDAIAQQLRESAGDLRTNLLTLRKFHEPTRTISSPRKGTALKRPNRQVTNGGIDSAQRFLCDRAAASNAPLLLLYAPPFNPFGKYGIFVQGKVRDVEYVSLIDHSAQVKGLREAWASAIRLFVIAVPPHDSPGKPDKSEVTQWQEMFVDLIREWLSE